MTGTRQGLRPVLLVEYDAHADRGHGPYDVALVGEHLASVGHEVHVLTMEGWRLDTGHGIPGAASMARAPRLVAAMHRLGVRLGQFSTPVAGRPSERFRRGIALALEWFTSVLPIRARSRALERMGIAPDDLAVVLLCGSLPFWACVTSAPRDGRWVLTRQRPPSSLRIGRARALARGLARRRRRRSRGVLRIAASTPEGTAAWRHLAPFLDVHTVPTGVYVPRPSISKRRARDELIRAHAINASTIALALGAVRPDRDFETLLGAFTDRDDDTHLVVAGVGVQAHLAALVGADPSLADARVTAAEGFVPDEDLDALIAAVDCLILPYRATNRGDSGLLHLAVAHSVPVVCSDVCAPAENVRRYGLGVLYSDGDRSSLRDAVERTRSLDVDPVGRGEYIEEYSVERFAERLLALAEDEPVAR